MALIPKITICSEGNCETWQVYDATGTYSTDNLGGFGAPNPTVANVTAATISFVLSDGTVIAAINVYDTLPNTNDVPFEITNTLAGITGTFPDGLTTWVYTITASGNTIVGNGSQYLLCNSECCARNFGSADLSCNKSKMKKFIKASEYLWLIKASVGCGNITAADKILTKLQRLCAGSGCGCESSCNC